MVMKQNWLDAIIQEELDHGKDEMTIANAIAYDPRFLAAIKRGMAKRSAPNVMGPSRAQVVRLEVVEELGKD